MSNMENIERARDEQERAGQYIFNKGSVEERHAKVEAKVAALPADDQKFFRNMQKALSPEYGDSRLYVYEDYDPQDPESATFIVADPWTVSKRPGECGWNYVLEASVYSPGGRETPPDVDVCEVATFTGVWPLLERLMTDDAKKVIELRLESVMDDDLVGPF